MMPLISVLSLFLVGTCFGAPAPGTFMTSPHLTYIVGGPPGPPMTYTYSYLHQPQVPLVPAPKNVHYHDGSLPHHPHHPEVFRTGLLNPDVIESTAGVLSKARDKTGIIIAQAQPESKPLLNPQEIKETAAVVADAGKKTGQIIAEGQAQGQLESSAPLSPELRQQQPQPQPAVPQQPGFPQPPAQGSQPQIPQPPAQGSQPQIPQPPAQGSQPQIPQPPAQGSQPQIPQPPPPGQQPQVPSAPQPPAPGQQPGGSQPQPEVPQPPQPPQPPSPPSSSSTPTLCVPPGVPQPPGGSNYPTCPPPSQAGSGGGPSFPSIPGFPTQAPTATPAPGGVHNPPEESGSGSGSGFPSIPGLPAFPAFPGSAAVQKEEISPEKEAEKEGKVKALASQSDILIISSDDTEVIENPELRSLISALAGNPHGNHRALFQ